MQALDLVNHIRAHRCYSHPIFQHWATFAPSTEAVGALFHHIQRLCACTRPALNFERGLSRLGLAQESEILASIVTSEADHAPQLATLAAHVVNLRAGKRLFEDLSDQPAIEARLAACSRETLGGLPGYDAASASLAADRRVWAVFGRRERDDAEATYLNIGALLAIELLANNHIIPGMIHCLLDAGLYGLSIDEPPLEYLREHAGETGAECWHEREAIRAVAGVLSPASEALVFQGAHEALDAIAELWDSVDKGLLV